MNSSNKVQIAIADDHPVICEGLKSLLEAIGIYEVPLCALSGLDLITLLKAAKTLPDACILDVSMAPLNGYETLLVIKKKWPQVKVIMLSMYDDDLLITKMLEAGASTYLAKNIPSAILNEAISHVLKNGYYYTAPVSKMILENAKKNHHGITDKEMRFLRLCCADLGYKEIADKMGVDVRTVENYRDSLFHKLSKHTKPV